MAKDTAAGKMGRGCVDYCGRLWGIVLNLGQRLGLLATPFQRRLHGEGAVSNSRAGGRLAVVNIFEIEFVYRW